MNPKTTQAYNRLKGLLHGVFLDRHVNRNEIMELKDWCYAHEELATDGPFKDFFYEIKAILDTGVVTAEEILDMNVILTDYRKHFIPKDQAIADINFLKGICYGILADGEINKHEVYMLKTWLKENEHLCTEPPYKNFYIIITKVLEDNKVDQEEAKMLKQLFSDFLSE
ncbi:hypothetical protein [Algoriphagus sediminis]|uniref:TerB family tellurite resistance protein n=1 Tax=Algoriphagus sediminis TaxID=3057113 RepID=A0ABT7Y9Y3_9BACT|nr:hypothetical protein [Algoriphagus sediminis]MDN3203308.1 hypothetical protein [Algoriphagus sediminis]